MLSLPQSQTWQRVWEVGWGCLAFRNDMWKSATRDRKKRGSIFDVGWQPDWVCWYRLQSVTKTHKNFSGRLYPSVHKLYVCVSMHTKTAQYGLQSKCNLRYTYFNSQLAAWISSQLVHAIKYTGMPLVKGLLRCCRWCLCSWQKLVLDLYYHWKMSTRFLFYARKQFQQISSDLSKNVRTLWWQSVLM